MLPTLSFFSRGLLLVAISSLPSLRASTDAPTTRSQGEFIHGQASNGEAASARFMTEVRLRKLHLVRPDLIPYPIETEVYC